MIELTVTDVNASRAWYESSLGLRLVTSDPATGFVLLQDDRGGRVALKRGVPNPIGVVLHFEVADVDQYMRERAMVVEGPMNVSAEGYREAFISDPDAHRVGLFAWECATGTSHAARG